MGEIQPIMSDSLIDSMSSLQEIGCLRKGIKIKDEVYTNNVLLILTKQLDTCGEMFASSLIAGGACSLIEQLFSTFPSSQSVILHALLILNMLTSWSSGATLVGSSSIHRKLFHQSETCCDIMKAIAAHLYDHAVVEQGIKLILYFSSHEILLKKLLSHENHYFKSLSVCSAERRVSVQSLTSSYSDLLVNVMYIYSGDVSLMKEICHIVYNLTYDDEEDSTGRCKSYLVDQGIGDLLIREILRPGNITPGMHSRGGEGSKSSEISLTVESSATDTRAQDVAISPSEVSVDIIHGDLKSKAIIKSLHIDDLNPESLDDIGVLTSVRRWSEEISRIKSNHKKNGCSIANSELDITLAKWGLRAVGSLCRHNSKNQQVFGLLGICDLIMDLKDLFLDQGIATTTAQNIGSRNSISDELHDNEIDDSSFAESFCWAVSNLADHDGAIDANQVKLISLGACEAVLYILKGCRKSTGVKGILMQEGCRALRNLCYSNRQGLEEFFKLGACDVILDIIRDNCNSVVLSSTSSSTPSPRLALPSPSIFSSFKTSAVQWAWYAVTALGKHDPDDADSDGLKSKIRASFGNNGACGLLFVTLSMYGVIPSSSPAITSACADVVQWTLSAMAVLGQDNSNLQLMLTTLPSSVMTLQPSTCNDDTLSQVDIKEEQDPPTKSNTITEKTKENYSFFSRSSSYILPLTAEEKMKIPSVRASILMKAMNSNLNNSDIAEEFCGAVHALITCNEDQEFPSSSNGNANTNVNGNATVLLVQSNKELLIAFGVNELLVKILLIHENVGLSSVEDEIVYSPVLEGALSAIAQLTNRHNDDLNQVQSTFELTAYPSIEKLVSNGLIRVMCRILSHYCTQYCSSNIILWGVNIIHDIAHYSPSGKYHSKLAKDGAVSCLMAALHKHAQWKQVTNLITKTMSTLVCGKIGIKFVKLFRIGGCCSALVQAVCVHYLGDDRASSVEMGQEERKRSEKGKGKGFVQNTSSLMLLTNVLRTICDLIDCDRIDLTSIDYTEICNCRSCLILEGAHEAVALLMRTHNINATAYTDCISSIGAKNDIIKLCLQVLSRLSGVTCSKSEKTDRETLSLACLSYLSLPSNVNPVSESIPIGASPTAASGSAYPYKESALQNENSSVLGPFLPICPGSSSGKEGETASLGLGVCTAVCALIKQVAGHIALLKKSDPLIKEFQGNGDQDREESIGGDGGENVSDNTEDEGRVEEEIASDKIERVEGGEENKGGDEGEIVSDKLERVEGGEENKGGDEGKNVTDNTENRGGNEGEIVPDNAENKEGDEGEITADNTENRGRNEGKNVPDNTEYKGGDEGEITSGNTENRGRNEGKNVPDNTEDKEGYEEEEVDVEQEFKSVGDEEGLTRDESARTDNIISVVEFDPELKIEDDMKVLLLAGCSAIESIVLSHYTHRFLLVEGGIIKHLVAALLLFIDRSNYSYEDRDDNSMTALCLAIGSIAKDYETSRRLLSKRNLKRDMDPFIQVLPALKAVLNECEIVETRLKNRSNSELTLDSGPETRINDTIELKTIAPMLTDTAVLSAAACRAIGHILSYQSYLLTGSSSKVNINTNMNIETLENPLLLSLKRHTSVLSSSIEACYAIGELSLYSIESSRRMISLGIQSLLITVLNQLKPISFKQNASASSSTLNPIVDHEGQVFCIVWCRTVYALLKANGSEFLTSKSETDKATSKDTRISRESLISTLLELASLDGSSGLLNASVCMTLSALVSIPYTAMNFRPKNILSATSENSDTLLLEKVSGSILQKSIMQSDWFSFSLQQAAQTISFSKSSNSIGTSSNQNTNSIASVTAGGITYWFSVFLFQLFSLKKNMRIRSSRNVLSALSSQLGLRNVCQSAGLCEILYKALGRFSYNESVTAACYMALSAILETPSIPVVSVYPTVKGEGDVDTEGEAEIEEEEEELENIEKEFVDRENNDFTTCSLEDVSPPSTSASLVSGAVLSLTFPSNKNHDEEREMGAVLLGFRRKLSTLGLGTSLVDSLRLYPSSRQVTDWSLRSMCFLLAHNEEIVHKICSANACEILPVCMQAHQSSPMASISGCVAIRRIIHCTYADAAFTIIPHTHAQSSAYAIRLGGAGACEAVISVFRHHCENAEAVISASRALAALAAVSKGNAGWLGPLGACESLLLAHDRHAGDKRVVSAIWNAVGTLCSYNRERFSNLGCAQYVVSSLQLHFQSNVDLGSDGTSSSALASSAAYAIGRLCEPLHDAARPVGLHNRRALHAAGCCEILATVLLREHSNITAATNIFRAISTMSNGLYSAKERKDFGTFGVCAALSVAMKEHLQHEEAALYGCQTIKALCSFGDQNNQGLLRSAGVCELVSSILKASFQSTLSSVSYSENSDASVTTVTVSEPPRGLFSQILSKARTFSTSTKSIVPARTRSSSISPVILANSPIQSSYSVHYVGFGQNWKDKLSVSLAAISAISCLSSSIDKINDCGELTCCTTATKETFGETGVIEIMVDIGNSLLVQGEGRDREKDPSTILAITQWTTLALIHLIDPTNDKYNGSGFDSDNEDLDYQPNVKKINLNLNRLCFCNRPGEFLVNAVLGSLGSSSGIAAGDIDALVYNALSIMVSMCEDKVGNHKILSSEGFSKMLLQCINRYNVATSGTAGKWMLLLCLSLVSFSSLNASLAEKLALGGICRLLSSALTTHLLPATTKAIQQQPFVDAQALSFSRQSANISLREGPATDEDRARDLEGGNEHEDLEADDVTALPPLPTIILPQRERSPSEIMLSSQSTLNVRRMSVSDYESVSFLSSSCQSGLPSRSVGDPKTQGLRSTAAVRDIMISGTANLVREGDESEINAENGELLAIVMSREACNALAQLLTILNVPDATAPSDRSLPSKDVAAILTKNNFSNSISLYREKSGNLVGILSALLLVADSSLLFFSTTDHKGTYNYDHKMKNSNSNSISNSGATSLNQTADESVSSTQHSSNCNRRDELPPSSILLPAIRELRKAAQTTINVLRLQQPHQRRNLL